MKERETCVKIAQLLRPSQASTLPGYVVRTGYTGMGRANEIDSIGLVMACFDTADPWCSQRGIKNMFLQVQ